MSPNDPDVVASRIYHDCIRAGDLGLDALRPMIANAIRAAVLEEREACAKIADADPYHTQSAEEIAMLIRSRT